MRNYAQISKSSNHRNMWKNTLQPQMHTFNILRNLSLGQHINDPRKHVSSKSNLKLPVGQKHCWGDWPVSGRSAPSAHWSVAAAAWRPGACHGLHHNDSPHRLGQGMGPCVWTRDASPQCVWGRGQLRGVLAQPFTLMWGQWFVLGGASYPESPSWWGPPCRPPLPSRPKKFVLPTPGAPGALWSRQTVAHWAVAQIYTMLMVPRLDLWRIQSYDGLFICFVKF